MCRRRVDGGYGHKVADEREKLGPKAPGILGNFAANMEQGLNYLCQIQSSASV